MPVMPSTRRARIDRWIASLTPLCRVINTRVQALTRLGEPKIQVGPTYIDGRVRRGAVWFVDGVNTGFHVDFMKDSTVYTAWTGDRRVTIIVAGKVSEATLDRDLRAVLLTAGLNHLTGSAREHIVTVTRRTAAPLKETEDA